MSCKLEKILNTLSVDEKPLSVDEFIKGINMSIWELGLEHRLYLRYEIVETRDPEWYRPHNFLKFRIIERSTNATFLCGTMPVDFDKKTIDMYAPKAIKEIQNIKNTIYENRERLEGYNEYH